MSWLLTLIILCFTHSYHPSEARSTRPNTKSPSALVVGSVYCDTCFQNDFSETSHFISGALVAVECDGTKSGQSFREEVQTNVHGQFKVHLPFKISKHVKKFEGCSVKLIGSSEPYCAVSSMAASNSFHLKSRNPGTHIFSAGFFTFKPLTQPNLCNQKPSFKNSNKFKNSAKNPNFDPSFPSPLPGKETPKAATDELSSQKFFGIFPPNPFQPPLIPNPLQPPPSILPPLIPSPPSSIFPPLFPTPPPSLFPPIIPAPPTSPPSLFPPIIPAPPTPPPSLFPPIFPSPPTAPTPPRSLFPPIPFFPPIPGFTPPPSLPRRAPPSIPLIPPFPFQPTPGIPPPASSSLSEETKP